MSIEIFVFNPSINHTNLYINTVVYIYKCETYIYNMIANAVK